MGLSSTRTWPLTKREITPGILQTITPSPWRGDFEMSCPWVQRYKWKWLARGKRRGMFTVRRVHSVQWLLARWGDIKTEGTMWMDPHNVPTQSRRDQSPSPSPSPSPTRLVPTVRTLLSIQKSRNVWKFPRYSFQKFSNAWANRRRGGGEAKTGFSENPPRGDHLLHNHILFTLCNF